MKKIQEILNTFIKSFLWNFSASPPLQFTLYFNSSTPPSKFHQISKLKKLITFHNFYELFITLLIKHHFLGLLRPFSYSKNSFSPFFFTFNKNFFFSSKNTFLFLNFFSNLFFSPSFPLGKALWFVPPEKIGREKIGGGSEPVSNDERVEPQRWGWFAQEGGTSGGGWLLKTIICVSRPEERN